MNEIEINRLAPHVNNIRENSVKCIMSHEEYMK